MPQADFYLLFKGIELHQANAISSPITYGFPAISGFVGAIHHLNRKLQNHYPECHLGGVMISCHHYELQAYRPHSFADYTFNQSRNPIKKNGDSASIIEEGKIHLNLNLVIEVFVQSNFKTDLHNNQEKILTFNRTLEQLLFQQRIAGGSVFHIQQTSLYPISQTEDILYQLQPAFVLIDATDELQAITKELQTGIQHYVDPFGDIVAVQDENNRPVLSHIKANPEATALDALIETVTLHHLPQKTEAKYHQWDTLSIKNGRGWLVPIAIGYQAISPRFKPGELANVRNPEYPSQYVETLHSLAKWVFPTHLHNNFAQYFWRYNQTENNLYLFTQGA